MHVRVHAGFLLLALGRRAEIGISRCVQSGGIRLRDLLARLTAPGPCAPVNGRPC